MPATTSVPIPASPRRRHGRPWGRVLVVVAVSVAGACGVLACGLGWMLMGFMGTAVEPWEPVVYPVGAVVCVLVPVLVGGRLLGVRGGHLRGGLAAGAITVAAVALVAVPVLGVATG